MPRIFISHSSKDDRQAIALKRWLVGTDRRLREEIFLDLDRYGGIQAGIRWKDALKQANSRCEAVICLLSTNWEASSECQTEFRMAETLNKRIFIARLEPSTGMGITRDWQWVDLFGVGHRVEVDIGDGAEPVYFSADGLDRLRDGIDSAGIGADLFPWPPPDDPSRAPYRGWEPFEERDAAVYFGREAEIIRGLDALRGIRKSGVESMFVVLGPSGSGKSSFLRAGLLPRLRRDDRAFFLLDPVRPERNVLTGDTGLARAIASTRARLGLNQPTLGEIKRACLQDDAQVHQLLAETQRAAARSFLGDDAAPAALPTVVIPVDQAEELVGTDAGPESGRFLELIQRYSEDDSTAKISLIVAMTIRTDHYEALQTAPELAGVKSVVFDDLRPMPDGQFREVIVGPADRASEAGRPLRVEPALVSQLLTDCREGADTLPLLSLTLARLYDEYGANGELTLRDYRQMGEMRKVVETEITAILSPDDAVRETELRSLRTAFVPWLATINPDNDQPVRRVARWNDLPADARPLLEKFIARRLLVHDRRPAGDVVEVALESLLRQWDQLKSWLEEERENLKQADTLERAAADWTTHDRNDAWLLEGQRITDAEALLQRPGFGVRLAGVQPFVDASRTREDLRRKEIQQRKAEDLRQRSAARKRRKRLAVAAAAAVITALVGGFVIVTSVRESGERARQNTAWRLVSDAEQMLKGGRSGGDVRALQQILVADRLGAPAAEGLASARRDLVKIMQIPPFKGEVTPVKSIAVSSDGRLIASASIDSKVRIWDTATGAQLHEIQVADKYQVLAVDFSPDGRWLATGSRERNLQIYDVESGQRISGPTDGAPVQSVAFDPAGWRVATAAEDGAVRLWDRITGRELGKLADLPTEITRVVAFGPGGATLAAGGEDGTVRIWDSDSGKLLYRSETDPSTVTGLALRPDGRRLVVARISGTLQLFDGQDPHPLRTVDAHPASISSVAFSPDGRRIATASVDNTIRFWDADTLTPIGQPFTGHHGEVSSVAFTADGSRLVSGGFDGSIRIWDVVIGLPIPTRQREVRAAAVSPDGHLIASAGSDGTVGLWSTDTGRWIRSLGESRPTGKLTALTAVSFNADGSRLAASSVDGSLRVWNLRDGTPTVLLTPVPPGPDGTADTAHIVKSVRFSRDGTLIASAGNDMILRLWSADTGALIGQHRAEATEDGETFGYQVWGIAFSPDGGKLASVAGGDYNYVQLWDVRPDQAGAPLTPDGDPMVGRQGYSLYSAAFSPDGRTLVTSGYDGTARIWDTTTRTERQPPIRAVQNPVLTVDFSHDGHWLATGGTDGRVRLWDATDGFAPIGVPLEGHRDWVSTVAFTPDDTRILSSSYDDTMQLWPAPEPLTDVLCDKLNSNMSHRQWDEWVSPDLDYIKVCEQLPIAADE